jgi:hypothetical protein
VKLIRNDGEVQYYYASVKTLQIIRGKEGKIINEKEKKEKDKDSDSGGEEIEGKNSNDHKTTQVFLFNNQQKEWHYSDGKYDFFDCLISYLM